MSDNHEQQYQNFLDASYRGDAQQALERVPPDVQKIGRFTIICLILNRTIGSGIFVTPARVLQGTGSVGTSIIFWFFGGLFATCGLLVWLVMGLSFPRARLGDTDETIPVPRSGGEKNYLEYAFPRPAFLTTCMYGIVFVILGNLSGNAIAFGQYCYYAAGVRDIAAHRGSIIGIAIAALSACVLLHVASRRGGILVSNAFAIVKVLLLIALIVLGFIKAGGHDLGGAAPTNQSNFNLAFGTAQHDAVGYTDALLVIMYTYSGFQQPFYVLSEAKSPQKLFPSSTLTAMAIAVVLFVLTNAAYLCAVSKLDVLQQKSNLDMASLFLEQVFGSEKAQRAMAALIAISIFGNILVMTFTAARVKQEIAKEGILPWSLTFATSHTTPWAWLKQRLSNQSAAQKHNEHHEEAPIAALGLHWLTSVFLIAVTSMLTPRESYVVLITLYSYVVVVGFGFVVSGAQLYLTWSRKHKWSEICNFKVPLHPLHTVVYFIVCGFLLFAAFAKPSHYSPFSSFNAGLPWYLLPTIGQSTWLWGIIWFAGLHLVMKFRKRVLKVERIPFNVEDEDNRGNYVQRVEVVTHEWQIKSIPPSKRKRQGSAVLQDGFEMS